MCINLLLITIIMRVSTNISLLQVFFNCLMPDHDARVFNPPRPDKESGYDNFVQILLEGLRRWDGIYFMHIAEHGYTYENTVVFFPFYPLLVRLIANTVLFPLQYILNYPNVLLIGGTLINLVAFVYAAKALYHLGCRVLEDEPMAFRAAQLFCINPASIFFSATYSESCFALLSFSGMLAIELNQTLRSAVFFGLCGLTRSNGILCLGYILYRKFRKGLSDFETIVRSNVGLLNTAIKISLHGFHFLLTEVFPGLFVCLLPFVSFQVYCYSIYCGIFKSNVSQIPRGIIDYGNQIKYRMPHQGFSVWCYNKIPLSYTYVQHHHWDVGFLKYYEWRQLPNFIAASPMAFLCLAAIIIYVSKNMIYSISLGLCEPEDSHYKKQEDPTDEQRTKNQGFFSPRCYPYIVHMIVLLISGIFFMHIQVRSSIIIKFYK